MFLYLHRFVLPPGHEAAAAGEREGGTRGTGTAGAVSPGGGTGSSSAAGGLPTPAGGGAPEGGDGEGASAGAPAPREGAEGEAALQHVEEQRPSRTNSGAGWSCNIRGGLRCWWQ